MIMCTTIERQKKSFCEIYQEQYDKEVALMRKRIEKLINKVEQTEKILK